MDTPVDVVLSEKSAGRSRHLHRHQGSLEALRLVEAKVASAHGHRCGTSNRSRCWKNLMQRRQDVVGFYNEQGIATVFVI